MKNKTGRTVRAAARASIFWHGFAALRTGGLGLATQFDEVSIPFINNAILDDWLNLESLSLSDDAVPQFVSWLNETVPLISVPPDAIAPFFYAWCLYNIGATAGSLGLLNKSKNASPASEPVPAKN
ncbi:MAG: hypothetical protein GC136_02900 [Alphaproteobacteria bacterium]|nr:hypothetical protein [Alphaproteobacteria bacterium]